MLQISELYVYPIKSLGGIAVKQAIITDRGFQHDRRWMLVDVNNRFLSQREIAAMALLKVNITVDGLQVINTINQNIIHLPFLPLKSEFIEVAIWDDICSAQLVSNEADNWFSVALGIECRLVYMPDDTRRLTDGRYSPADNITSFSDAYPFMMIGQASLDDLNSRLAIPLPINRFRPNIVFTGGYPYQEDIIDRIIINNIPFNGVKLCARCNIPTIDQTTGIASKEPTKTMASYRAKNHNVYLGQNLVHSGSGTISVGDELSIISVHHEDRFLISR